VRELTATRWVDITGTAYPMRIALIDALEYSPVDRMQLLGKDVRIDGQVLEVTGVSDTVRSDGCWELSVRAHS
jgi:hypothetical protein